MVGHPCATRRLASATATGGVTLGACALGALYLPQRQRVVNALMSLARVILLTEQSVKPSFT